MGEVGCLLAHALARSLASKPWALVLEDDAVLDMQMVIKASLELEKILPSGPSIVSLADVPKFKALKPKLRRLRFAPSTTLAYFFSRSCSELDEKFSSRIGLADWPLSFAQVKFYSFWGSVVEELKTESTIDSGHIRERNALSYYVKISLQLPRLMVLLGYESVRHFFFQPLLRDLAFKMEFLRVRKRLTFK